VESFYGKLWDELLKGEILHTLQQAKILIESWGAANLPRNNPIKLFAKKIFWPKWQSLIV